jgi:hypothetical protein
MNPQDMVGGHFNQCKPVELFWWIFMRHPFTFLDAMAVILEAVDYNNSTKLSVCLASQCIIFFLHRLP